MSAKHTAVEVAPQKIAKDYAGAAPKSLSWDEATTLVVEHMKQYYLAPDEEAIADSVFDRLRQ